MFYNFNKVEQGEAEIVAVRNFPDDKFGTIYRTLLERDAMAINTKKPSIHIVLSGDDGENLTDGEAVELLEQMLKDVGLDRQPYVIVRHDDTDHVHYHIFSTKVCEDGKSVIWNCIGKRLVHSLSKYQEKYGFVASQNLHHKKQNEISRRGLVDELNAKMDHLINDRTVLTVEVAKAKMLSEGIIMTEFNSKHTKKKMIRLRKQNCRPEYIDSDKTERLYNAIDENRKSFGEELAAFVIRGANDATLYVKKKKTSKEREKILEAARTVLKYYTWAADIQYSMKEFIEKASRGRPYGFVKVEMEKVRFVGMGTNQVVENPEEVFTFFDSDLKTVDMFTAAFRVEWHGMVENARDYRSNTDNKLEDEPIIQIEDDGIPTQEPGLESMHQQQSKRDLKEKTTTRKLKRRKKGIKM